VDVMETRSFREIGWPYSKRATGVCKFCTSEGREAGRERRHAGVLFFIPPAATKGRGRSSP
jgi:hypothetical protein